MYKIVGGMDIRRINSIHLDMGLEKILLGGGGKKYLITDANILVKI